MPRALAMPPRSVFRGNVPENDIVVAENYIDDFIAIIDMKKAKRKRRTMKAKTDAKVTNTMTGKKSMQRRAAGGNANAKRGTAEAGTAEAAVAASVDKE